MNKTAIRILGACFLAFVMILLISGCASVPTENVVYKTKYVLVTVEDAYLKPTPVRAPPKVGEYAAGQEVDWEAEYIKSTEALITIYGDVGQCNADKLAIKADILAKQRKYD